MENFIFRAVDINSLITNAPKQSIDLHCKPIDRRGVKNPFELLRLIFLAKIANSF